MNLITKHVKQWAKPLKRIDDGFESQDEYNIRWRSITVIFIAMLIMSTTSSIALTGIWPFLNKVNCNILRCKSNKN